MGLGTWLGVAHQAGKVRHLLDGLAVIARDHVARLYASLLRGGSSLHAAHQRAVGFAKPDGLRHILGNRANLNTNAATAHATAHAQLLAHAHGLVNGNGERDTHESAGAGVDLAVDAHHLTPHVDQRAAGVTGIDGHIRLNEGQIVTRIALLGTHDAGGHGVFQAKGRADCHDPFTRLKTAHVTHLYRGQSRGVDLDDGNVGALVRANDLGLELPLVRQRHDHFVRPLHHVGVGHDIAVRTQNEPRSHATRLLFGLRTLRPLLAWNVGHRDTKAPEELQHVFIHAPDGGPRRYLLGCANVHHGRPHLLDQFGEVRQATHHGRRLGLHRSGRRHQACAAHCQGDGHSAGPPCALCTEFRHHQPFFSRQPATAGIAVCEKAARIGSRTPGTACITRPCVGRTR